MLKSFVHLVELLCTLTFHFRYYAHPGSGSWYLSQTLPEVGRGESLSIHERVVDCVYSVCVMYPISQLELT